MDPIGLQNRLAEVIDDLDAGDLTRDQISAKNGVKHCLKMFAELQATRDQRKDVDSLVTELRATQRLMKKDHGGASLSFENPDPLPLEGSGEPH